MTWFNREVLIGAVIWVSARECLGFGTLTLLGKLILRRPCLRSDPDIANARGVEWLTRMSLRDIS
jgi:hypothetical protein